MRHPFIAFVPYVGLYLCKRQGKEWMEAFAKTPFFHLWAIWQIVYVIATLYFVNFFNPWLALIGGFLAFFYISSKP